MYFSISGVLFGTLFLKLKAHKISIKNTPIENIDDFVFYGVNETLSELELINTSLTNVSKSFKVSMLRPLFSIDH